MKNTKPTSRKLLGSDVYDKAEAAKRQVREAAERERWCMRIAKHWRSKGKSDWSDAEMNAAIDKMVERDRKAQSSTPSVPQLPVAGQQLQPSLFGADEASSKTRAAAAVAARDRGSRRDEIVDSIRRAGAIGRTSDELSIELEIPMHSLSGTIKALVDCERLVRTKRTRTTRTNHQASVLIAPNVSRELGQ